MPSDFIIIGGVSGCGKSTIGKALAEKLDAEFVDGDKFHTHENIEKMSKGIALNDDDRHGWLVHLSSMASNDKCKVLACSALKEKYRQILSANSANCKIFLLILSESVLRDRVENRQGHFMKSMLLKSQLDTLEQPTATEKDHVFAIDGDRPIPQVIDDILSHISQPSKT